jgi:hypothetical protein
MAHKIQWLFYPRILHVELYGDLDFDNLQQFNDELVTHLEQGEAPVHVIIDDTNVGKPPLQLGKLKRILPYIQHPSLGWQVGIGTVNPLVNYMAPMLMKLARVSFIRRQTQEEALQALVKQDASLSAVINETPVTD